MSPLVTCIFACDTVPCEPQNYRLRGNKISLVTDLGDDSHARKNRGTSLRNIFFWGVFQFLMENKNRINCIFFQEVYFPKNLSELAIFGQVLLRYKSCEILCEFLPACGKL